MTTRVYSSRVTNWLLFWLVTALAVVLCVVPIASGASVTAPLAVAVALVVVNLMLTSLRTTVGPAGVIVRFGARRPADRARRGVAAARPRGGERRRDQRRRSGSGRGGPAGVSRAVAAPRGAGLPGWRHER